MYSLTIKALINVIKQKTGGKKYEQEKRGPRWNSWRCLRMKQLISSDGWLWKNILRQTKSEWIQEKEWMTLETKQEIIWAVCYREWWGFSYSIKRYKLKCCGIWIHETTSHCLSVYVNMLLITALEPFPCLSLENL